MQLITLTLDMISVENFISTRDKINLQYINKTILYKLVLRRWVKLKIHFLTCIRVMD